MISDLNKCTRVLNIFGNRHHTNADQIKQILNKSEVLNRITVQITIWRSLLYFKLIPEFNSFCSTPRSWPFLKTHGR